MCHSALSTISDIPDIQEAWNRMDGWVSFAEGPRVAAKVVAPRLKLDSLWVVLMGVRAVAFVL